MDHFRAVDDGSTNEKEDKGMATKSHVRVFSASHAKPNELDEQINDVIEQRGYEVKAVSISVGHGKLVALVVFKKLD